MGDDHSLYTVDTRLCDPNTLAPYNIDSFVIFASFIAPIQFESWRLLAFIVNSTLIQLD